MADEQAELNPQEQALYERLKDLEMKVGQVQGRAMQAGREDIVQQMGQEIAQYETEQQEMRDVQSDQLASTVKRSGMMAMVVPVAVALGAAVTAFSRMGPKDGENRYATRALAGGAAAILGGAVSAAVTLPFWMKRLNNKMQEQGAESAEQSISGMEAIINKYEQMLPPEPTIP